MFTLEDILAGTGGRLHHPQPLFERFESVVIDSRQAKPGSLFFALVGEWVDGHDYVLNAIENGATGAVVREDWLVPDRWPPGKPLIRVDDPLSALQRLAAWWRAISDVQVVGITGSIGKTSTKEVVAAVLSTRFSTLKSEGNLNNEIGLPLTLLRLTADHRKAVLEMGAGYALGELTMLCEWARPEIAVVTSVHPVHLERMGTIERIALNKSELPRSLPPGGTAVLNGDDPLVRAMADVTRARVLLYGRRAERDGQRLALDIWATDVESRGLDGVIFRLHFGETGESWPVRLPLLGAHHVYSAMAAAGVAYAAGMEWGDIVAALEELEVQGRVRLVPGYNGCTLIDDTYNAAPASVVAALDLLGEMQGRHIAVLGDMRELGSHEEEGHRQVGRHAAHVADHLVAVGRVGRLIGEEAITSGMPPANVVFAQGNAQAVDYLKPLLQPGDHVLVKGSRGMQMEEIIDRLKMD
jgi:UDP-N-acetylmuramoyl-tripeptide--D-alanyl-D-alanine ligase